MSAKYEKLKTLLRELFQLDQPDLDFGIYRIMHARSAEIGKFLDEDLLPQVRASFAAYQPADKAAIKAELDKAIAQAQALGADPETLPKVKELRAKLANEAIDIAALEGEVYDHLYSFFRRYYSEGDFISKRVYKEGVYAIPYEGEEVKLHWANSDQYYIKTSEYLRDYAFRLQPGNPSDQMRVHFRLVDAQEGEHGNIKEAEGKARLFILAAGDYISEENGELVIKFEYRPATLQDWLEAERDGKTKPPAQKELLAQAEKRILGVTGTGLSRWMDLLGSKHRLANGEQADYTRLAAHLNRYTARNTFDYFIHKDLGGFLKRELDFYIKNEVMHLDDVENESAPRVEQYLSKIKVIRKIATKLIDFLAQLENFQKKLWLKKKFVVETNYCITLDRIPEEFYPEIAANDAQREEWVRLFAIDEIVTEVGDLLPLANSKYSNPLTIEFLNENRKLIIDTKLFSEDFSSRLISAIEELDMQSDGFLVYGENYQALNLIQNKYLEQIKTIYLDPPYNTNSDAFLYKDGYKHSSWASMIENRVVKTIPFLTEDYLLGVSIDRNEEKVLDAILKNSIGSDNYVNTISVVNNPQGRSDEKNIATSHEFLSVFAGDSFISQGWQAEDNVLKRFRSIDGEQKYRETDLRKTGKGDRREDRENMFYYFFYKENTELLLGKNLDECPSGYTAIKPIRPDGSEGRWRWGMDTAKKNMTLLVAKKMERRDVWTVYEKDYLEKNQRVKPVSVWSKPSFISHYASDEFEALGFTNKEFEHPKAISLIKHFLCQNPEEDSIVLDYFAGSGTTGHAIISMNREDSGNRKYILVEMGYYFDTVLLPRIKKAVYSESWKNGKPIARESGSSQFVKYIRLESYEDTLNNLELNRTPAQQALLDLAESKGDGKLSEDYTLRYLLDIESRDSPSLLSIDRFVDPTAYKLKVKKPGSDESSEVSVDLIETFNYLIGLKVSHISEPHVLTADFARDGEKRLNIARGSLRPKADGKWWFRNVMGSLLDGRRVLVIWRKRPGEETSEGLEQDNLVLDEWFKSKQGYSTKDSEFDLIYVNGTNNLENLKTPDDLWKVRLIEEDFFRLMFEDTEA